MFIFKGKTFFIIGLIFITVFLVLFLKPQYELVIEDKTNKKFFKYELPEKNFSLGYIHSVMKTEAEEFFIINKEEKIELVKTEYKSYGVGLPFLPEEGELKIENGKFILYIHREFKNISMMISPIGKHYLRIGNEKYILSEVLGDEPVKIELNIKKTYKF